MENHTLEKFDKIVKNSLEDILNIELHERAYNQATLPIALGGLGLRPAMEVALAGFLSSVCATKVEDQINRFWDFACNLWKEKST